MEDMKVVNPFAGLDQLGMALMVARDQDSRNPHPGEHPNGLLKASAHQRKIARANRKVHLFRSLDKLLAGHSVKMNIAEQDIFHAWTPLGRRHRHVA
jgi:hypothetical protein